MAAHGQPRFASRKRKTYFLQITKLFEFLAIMDIRALRSHSRLDAEGHRATRQRNCHFRPKIMERRPIFVTRVFVSSERFHIGSLLDSFFFKSANYSDSTIVKIAYASQDRWNDRRDTAEQ
jgi:hypothetical protein